MKTVNKIYINGEFVTPHGTEIFDVINPSTNQKIGEVSLADETDTKKAIAGAKEAFKTFSKSTVAERIDYLTKLKIAVEKRQQDFIDIMIEEYGGTHQFVTMSNIHTGAWFDSMIEVLQTYEFEKTINSSLVKLRPVGVVGIITPWNASNSSVCSKVATAVAAGCTVVIKPSEMSSLQTQVLMEAYVDRPQTVYVNTAPGDDGETITPIEMKWAENGHNSVFVPEDAGRGSDKTIFYDNEGKPLTTNDKVEVSFEVGKASIYPYEVRIDKVK